jgi:hypothetical protein
MTWWWETSEESSAEDNRNKIDNNVNSTIYFENIFNFHNNHAKKLENIETYVLSIGAVILIVIFAIIIYFIYKQLVKTHEYKVNEKAKVIALELIEQGVVKKNKNEVN